MVLSTQQCLAHIEHALNGPIDSIEPLEVINQAGMTLLGLRSWAWLQAGKATLSLTSGQAYVNLPLDFKKLRAIEHQSSLVSFQMGSKADLLALEASSTGLGGLAFWGSLTCARQLDSNGDETYGAPRWRIDLHPPPTADATDALIVYYDRKWATVAEDNNVVVLPDFMEPVFVQVLRAFAQGYEEPNNGSVDARLAGIVAGVTYHSALAHDTMAQGPAGPLRGGMAQGPRGYSRNWNGMIIDP